MNVHAELEPAVIEFAKEGVVLRAEFSRESRTLILFRRDVPWTAPTWYSSIMSIGLTTKSWSNRSSEEKDCPPTIFLDRRQRLPDRLHLLSSLLVVEIRHSCGPRVPPAQNTLRRVPFGNSSTSWAYPSHRHPSHPGGPPCLPPSSPRAGRAP